LSAIVEFFCSGSLSGPEHPHKKNSRAKSTGQEEQLKIGQQTKQNFY
jgi:hypothetical protein